MNHRSKPATAPSDCEAPPSAHPLDLIRFFRRRPPSLRRDLLYTLIWNCGLGTVLTVVEMYWSNFDQPVLKHWVPMLVIANLIGFLIHLGSLLANAVGNGWPRRATGLPRLLFNTALVAVSVLLGLSMGNALLSGKSIMQLMANRSALTQSMAVAAAVALLMYLVNRGAEQRVAQALEKARQQELMASSARMLAEARLRALQAQIEPHFLYNTLANVVSLIGPQPAKAQHMLERFIDYLRASLAVSRSEEATLGSEARLIAAYLDVLAVRMGERLRYRIEVPDRLRQFAIAPMLLQPVVENAISHGLEPKVEGGEIVVSAVEMGGHLCVQISDTGVGLDSTMSAKPGGGVGLSNLRERLRSLYGGAARVELLENQPCGMMVRLMLPLNASPTSIHSEH
ncbi:sensor histidine kinase [Duganella sp. BJB488]|uniref:sensor histidine kinase n=1 Tax=unclassified Duganella TaxID=2636909 RepID=UPI000E35094A|nr:MULTISPECIES: histidine kinase [unclassified Duganella]NVD71715.1 histidine kinase [Duganella sp. BJB1802]RFP17599.1 sensor histidine kinase [Duganella sp. BJB489]RFP22381.1 sensor histidine kinase [Duganella sp. BJB488]RFP37443.1 sensor histidine kinase [Duganella sp. BJB480]